MSLRPFREVAISDHIDGWRVCWIGGWDKCRVLFVVMVERPKLSRPIRSARCASQAQDYRGEPPPPILTGAALFIDPTECISDVACSVWVGGGRVHLRARRLKNEISRSTYWDLRTASPTAEIDAHIHKPERHTLRRVVSTVLAICRPRSNSVRAHLPPDISPPAAKPATTSKTR
jgi:hypothetical protein